MRFQRVLKDQIDAYEFTSPMSEELIDALKEREGMYVSKTGKNGGLIVHTLFKDKKATEGDYILFMPDGTLDVQDKETFFSKFEPVNED